MARRERDIQVKFRVTQEELGFIAHKMQQLGTRNREAYLRKMAIDGLVIKLDIPELKEMIHLLRKMGNNINQIAKQVNTTQQLHTADYHYIQQSLDAIWDKANEILKSLVALK